ncbi:hypothetical protein, partial [Escherichia coli]|uniref:hypothetical protein n=1 Tax=Escherichia coli TaxID=562 RepID=UPI002964ED12
MFIPLLLRNPAFCMYSAVGSQFFSQLHKAFVLSLQVMAVNPGITFCEPGWIAGEVTLQGTVAKLAMRQPFVLFKGLTFQKLCL